MMRPVLAGKKALTDEEKKFSKTQLKKFEARRRGPDPIPPPPFSRHCFTILEKARVEDYEQTWHCKRICARRTAL